MRGRCYGWGHILTQCSQGVYCTLCWAGIAQTSTNAPWGVFGRARGQTYVRSCWGQVPQRNCRGQHVSQVESCPKEREAKQAAKGQGPQPPPPPGPLPALATGEKVKTGLQSAAKDGFSRMDEWGPQGRFDCFSFASLLCSGMVENRRMGSPILAAGHRVVRWRASGGDGIRL